MRSLLAELPPRLGCFVSAEVGLVTRLEESLADVRDPLLLQVSCELADGRGLVGTSLGHADGIGGTGFSRSAAASAAIGEAVERYSGSFVPRERLVFATARELGPAAVDPASFALFCDEQYASPEFPFTRFTQDTRVAWVDGTDLRTGELGWVPAELVYLGSVTRPETPRIGYATSSGLACAESRAEATVRGVLELLERDAFSLTWNRRISPPRLQWTGSPRFEVLAAQYFDPSGLDYAALDLSDVHELPTVLAVVRGRGGAAGALGVGAAASFDPERAWWKALSEAFASRSASHKLSLLRPERRFARPEVDVTSFEDHIQFYADPVRALAASFLLASRERRDVAALPTPARGGIEALVERAGRAGSSCYAVDVTSPDVADAGLSVVKTLAPALCSLDVLHAARFLGSPRLWDTSGRDTLTPGSRRIEDLNADPHPFP